jgi:hypothetical protein
MHFAEMGNKSLIGQTKTSLFQGIRLITLFEERIYLHNLFTAKYGQFRVFSEVKSAKSISHGLFGETLNS